MFMRGVKVHGGAQKRACYTRDECGDYRRPPDTIVTADAQHFAAVELMPSHHGQYFKRCLITIAQQGGKN